MELFSAALVIISINSVIIIKVPLMTYFKKLIIDRTMLVVRNMRAETKTLWNVKKINYQIRFHSNVRKITIFPFVVAE